MSGTGRRVIGASARLPETGHEDGDGAWHRLRAGRTDAAWRLSVTAVVAALVAVTGIVFAVLQAQPAPPRAAPAAGPSPAGDTASAAARANAAPSPGPAGAGASQGVSIPQAGALVHAAVAYTVPPARTAPPAQQAAAPLVLTAADHQDCPARATACVDLARHLTWLQADGKTTFGPVAMEPGKPGGKHQTPTGTFHVAWKAGPGYMSTTYNEPMPWATFFAVGGIAFHGGPLDQWSHGCVHLTTGNAHYYNTHLPIGAEVVVF